MNATLRAGVALLAAAGLVLVLAACGGGKDKKSKTTTVTRTVAPRAARTTTTPAPTQTTPSGLVGAGTEGTPGSASTDADGGVVGTPGLTGDTSTGIIRPFSAQSPWNTTVLGQRPDNNSDRLIRLVEERIGVKESGNVVKQQRRVINDPLYINTVKWTDPVVDEQGGEPTRVVCRQIPTDCGDGPTVTSLLIPPDESPLPQYDGWFTVLNRRQGVAYDMWRARRARGTNLISYQFMRKWALNGPGFQQPNNVSARGSGLPLFAGLILPEEIRAGRIEHALAISLPGPAQRNYVQPASATDGNGRLTSLPEGARIRLKPGIRMRTAHCPVRQRLNRFNKPIVRRDCLPSRTSRRASRAIFEALRRYGAIVVDRSRVPTLYGKLNTNWAAPLRSADGVLLDDSGRRRLNRFTRKLPDQGTPLLRGNEVQFLRVSDFEVVSLPAILKFPPLGSTQTASQSFTPVVP